MLLSCFPVLEVMPQRSAHDATDRLAFGLRQLSNLDREVVCQLGLDRSRKTGQ